MDLNSVEYTVVKALGGADQLTVNDLTGTGMTDVLPDLRSFSGDDDGAADSIIVNATAGGDVVSVAGSNTGVRVGRLASTLTAIGTFPATDRVVVNALAGDDVVDGSALAADTAPLTADGSDGDDVLLGGPGQDVLDGGPGSNVVIDSLQASAISSAGVAGASWLTANARTVDGKTVLQVDGEPRVLPRAKLKRLVRNAAV